MIYMPGWLIGLTLLTACATLRPDHFYTLTANPAPTEVSRSAFARQLNLHVTLPSLVDRAEMVLSSHDEVSILEHERWASPLLDQLTGALGQDLEARRSDLVIANRSLEQSAIPLSDIAVEIVALTAQRGGSVSIEVRWRITDSVAGNVLVGRDIFTAPMMADDYSQVAVALSLCVAQLADKLIAQLPPV